MLVHCKLNQCDDFALVFYTTAVMNWNVYVYWGVFQPHITGSIVDKSVCVRLVEIHSVSLLQTDETDRTWSSNDTTATALSIIVLLIGQNSLFLYRTDMNAL